MGSRLAVFALLFFGSIAGGASAQEGDGDLQAVAQNPVANLISVPFQNNLLFGVGPKDEIVNVLNIQPVIAISLSITTSESFRLSSACTRP